MCAQVSDSSGSVRMHVLVWSQQETVMCAPEGFSNPATTNEYLASYAIYLSGFAIAGAGG